MRGMKFALPIIGLGLLAATPVPPATSITIVSRVMTADDVATLNVAHLIATRLQSKHVETAQAVNPTHEQAKGVIAWLSCRAGIGRISCSVTLTRAPRATRSFKTSGTPVEVAISLADDITGQLIARQMEIQR